MAIEQRVKKIKRRRLIQKIGWFSISVLLAKGCASPNANGSTESAQTPSALDSSQAVKSSSSTCVLYPEQTEGPYYSDLDLIRQDITEGKDGVPLRLLLTVTNVEGCSPISGAAVDIWHCDAEGNYAGYSAATTAPPQPPPNGDRSNQPAPALREGNNSGETFLRGTQMTDENGRVEFLTVYPGWYRGRTTHIHFKVHLGSNTVVTSQMYFPESITQAVYAQAPYNSRPNQALTNAQDRIIGDSQAVLLALSKEQASYTGRLTVAVAT